MEPAMNTDFKPLDRSERTIAIVIAIVVTLLLIGVVLGLARGYDMQFLRIGTGQAHAAVVTPQRKTSVGRGAQSW